jgi:hypothetical protein
LFIFKLSKVILVSNFAKEIVNFKQNNQKIMVFIVISHTFITQNSIDSNKNNFKKLTTSSRLEKNS